MPANTKPKVASGKEWRQEREQGRLETLPSGKTVVLNKVRLRDFLSQGDIPNPLMPVVVGMMAGQKWTPSTAEDIQLYFDLLDFVCIKAFRQPKIVRDPQANDEISIEDVDLDDQLYVFNIAQQEIRFLTPFRPQPDRDVAASQNGQDLSGEAQPDAGSSG